MLIPKPEPPSPTATVDALVVELRTLTERALLIAQAVDVQISQVLNRGYTTSLESSLLQVWRNDAAAAYLLVEAARKVTDYILRQRHVPTR